ncbi:hypothetical protein [Pectobacterium polaris]|uniref:hypothetical protein n=1 Tax=Pectobacterium polaris TaxID=2042057 RepID=UPI001F3A11E9|nr:hypothetical protein [Pectobacterium polaris]
MSSFARDLKLVIVNASGADISVTYGVLTGAGAWETTPVSGTVIPSGGQLSYLSGVDNTLKAFGGNLLMTPANGGTITPQWDWPASGPLTGSVTYTALDSLTVSSSITGSATNHATQQVTIMNAALALKVQEMAAKA